MAKAKEITGLDCAADAEVWAAEVLRVRFEEVIGLRGAALDFSDIKGVHDMRVATRRLRGALRDFMPFMKTRPSKSVRRNLKKIADALGSVRDQDVAIVALETLETEAEIDVIKQGIEKLLNERRALRDVARLDLTEAIAVSRVNDLQERFTAAMEKSAAARNKPKRAVSFSEAGRRAVTKALTEMLDLGTSLYEPFKTEELHEMRIAAKRLRYAIELFTACWGEKISPFAEEIAQMQAFLGEVHDCDIWIESLGQGLRRMEAKESDNESDYQTAAWLLSEIYKKRTREYRAALKLWSQWKADSFAERMREAVTS